MKLGHLDKAGESLVKVAQLFSLRTKTPRGLTQGAHVII